MQGCGTDAIAASRYRPERICAIDYPSVMHTPQGFVPSHQLPEAVPDAALAFAFSGDKMLVAGTDAAPTVPTLGELGRAGIDGARHYLGHLSGAPCIAIGLANPIAVRLRIAAKHLRLPAREASDTTLATGVSPWSKRYKIS